MKKFKLLLLFLLFIQINQTAAHPHHNQKIPPALQKKYDKALKDYQKITSEIALTKKTLATKIAHTFPYNNQNLYVITSQNTNSKLILPYLVLENTAGTTPTIDQIKSAIEETFNFIKKRIHDSQHKDFVFEKIKLEQALNFLKKNFDMLLTANQNNSNTPNPVTCKFFLEICKKIAAIETELEQFEDTAVETDGKNKAFTTKKNSAYGAVLSATGNLTDAFSYLDGTINDYLFLLLEKTPKPNRTTFEAEFKTLDVTLAPATHNDYQKTIETLIDKINFQKAPISIFSAFNSTKTLNTEANTLYTKTDIAFKNELDCIEKTTWKAKEKNPNFAPPQLITDTLHLILDARTKMGSSIPAVKTAAKKIKAIQKNLVWIETLRKCIKEKDVPSTKIWVSVNKMIDVLCKDIVETPLVLEYIAERLSGKYIVPRCTRLMQQTNITINNPEYKDSQKTFHRGTLGLLFWIHICQKIDKKFTKELIQLHTLQETETKLQLLTQTLKNNIQTYTTKQDTKEEISEEEKKASNEKNCEKENEIAPQKECSFDLTRKLKKTRCLANRLINLPDFQYSNELSDAQAAAYHNLPLQTIAHGKITEIIGLLKAGTNPAKISSIIFEYDNPQIKFWLPAVLAYTENGKEIIEKGAIEIFIEIPENKNSAYLIFHVWFKNQTILQKDSKISAPTYKKIVQQLNKFSTHTIKDKVELIDQTNIIPESNLWATQILPNNKNVLLCNTKKSDAKIMWVYYQIPQTK